VIVLLNPSLEQRVESMDYFLYIVLEKLIRQLMPRPQNTDIVDEEIATKKSGREDHLTLIT